MPDESAVDDITGFDLPDVRSVAVLWSDADPQPDVVFSGCSAFEAIGLMRQGLRKLERMYDLPLDDEDEDDFA